MGLAAAAVYAPSLGNGFAFDDQTVILDAAHLLGDPALLPRLFTSDYFALSGEATFRPAVTASYVFDWWIGGGKPLAFHLQSILWHVLASLLVLRLCTRTGLSAFAALFGALVFAVHPVLTEAVDAISFREDVLATALGVGALLVFLAPGDGGRRWRRAAVGGLLLLLALLSKETALAFVLLVPLAGWAVGARRIARAPAIAVGGAAVLVFAFLRFVAFASPPTYAEFAGGTRWTGLASGLAALLHYVRLVVWPHPLCADYRGVVEPVTTAGDARTWLGAALLVALLLAAVRCRRRSPVLTLGLAWFLLGLLPAANLVPIPVFLAERFLYLPLVGVALAAGAGIDAVLARFGCGWPQAGLAVLCLLALGTVQRHGVWRDDLTLWRTTLDAHPGAYGALHGYATALQESGEPDEAIPLHLRALEHAAMPAYERAAILRSLGTAYGMTGDLEASADTLQRSLALEPNAKAHYHLAIAWLRLGRAADAERACRLALALDPALPAAHLTLIDLLRARGEHREADQLQRRHAELVRD